jgi:hypothetical protein
LAERGTSGIGNLFSASRAKATPTLKNWKEQKGFIIFHHIFVDE